MYKDGQEFRQPAVKVPCFRFQVPGVTSIRRYFDTALPPAYPAPRRVSLARDPELVEGRPCERQPCRINGNRAFPPEFWILASGFLGYRGTPLGSVLVIHTFERKALNYS